VWHGIEVAGTTGLEPAASAVTALPELGLQQTGSLLPPDKGILGTEMREDFFGSGSVIGPK
jgi:hypothetical protein